MSIEIQPKPTVTTEYPVFGGMAKILSFGQYVASDRSEMNRAILRFWKGNCSKCVLWECTARGMGGQAGDDFARPTGPTATKIRTEGKGRSQQVFYDVTAAVAIPTASENNADELVEKGYCDPQVK